MIAHGRGEREGFESAVACFEAAVAAYQEEEGTEYAIATTLTNLGSTYYDLGRYDEANIRLTAALDLDRKVGNRPSEAVALHGLGNVAEALGDLATARSYYDQALDVRRSIGDRFGEAVILEDVAGADAKEGARAAAAAAYDQAADLMADLDPVKSAELRARAAELR
jgi:tetratricopeptide (TPR) repeat protein